MKCAQTEPAEGPLSRNSCAPRILQIDAFDEPIAYARLRKDVSGLRGICFNLVPLSRHINRFEPRSRLFLNQCGKGNHVRAILVSDRIHSPVNFLIFIFFLIVRELIEKR